MRQYIGLRQQKDTVPTIMKGLISKEVFMHEQTQSTLDVICENWRGCQEKLRECITPLTSKQLGLQPATGMWPLGQILQHIISVRAGKMPQWIREG